MKRLFGLVFLPVLLFCQSSTLGQDPFTYEVELDPIIGFNLSAHISERDGKKNWVEGVESLVANRVKDVNIVVFRKVHGKLGHILPASGPRIAHIEAAIKRAKVRGMQVTVTPIFEVTTGKAWRGDWDPVGIPRQTFCRNYKSFVLELARISNRHSVDHLNVGSELQAFTANPINKAYLLDLIDDVSGAYKGSIGYAANWDSYYLEHVKEIFWDHAKINQIRISLYPHNFISPNFADDSNKDKLSFENRVFKKWERLLATELIPYADSTNGGQGMPIVIQEFGVVPYNRCTSVPWSHTPGISTGLPKETVDQKEQEAYVMGFIRATNGLGQKIKSIDFWTWGFSSNQFDRYSMNPEMKNPSQATATRIINYIQTDDNQ